MGDYTVVLKSIAQGKYIEVARALQSVLGLKEQAAGQIVSSLPLVLFGGLTDHQARAITQAMAPVEQAGAKLDLTPLPGRAYARMKWPEPPTVAGRDLASFASAQPSAQPSATLRCPVCGAELALVPAGSPAGAEPAAAPAQPSAAIVQSGPAFEVTGEGDLEMLGEIDVGARAPDVPDVPAATKSPAPPPTPPTGAVPMDLEDFEASFASQAEEELGRDDVLQELGEAQARPLAGAQAAPPEPKPAPRTPPTQPVTPAKPGSGPRAPVRRRRKSRKASGSAAIPSAGTGMYSVFAAKANSPRFLQLVAEVRGISLQAAKDLAKRQVVQVARDVSQEEAETIRDRFVAEKFQARVHGGKGD